MWFIDPCASKLPRVGSAAGAAGRGFGRIREPEEGQAIAIADIEEEVLAPAHQQVDGLGKRHPQHVAVEFHCSRHVLAHQGKVVDAHEIEFRIGRGHHPSPLVF
jgi:hypothetical protein